MLSIIILLQLLVKKYKIMVSYLIPLAINLFLQENPNLQILNNK